MWVVVQVYTCSYPFPLLLLRFAPVLRHYFLSLPLSLSLQFSWVDRGWQGEFHFGQSWVKVELKIHLKSSATNQHWIQQALKQVTLVRPWHLRVQLKKPCQMNSGAKLPMVQLKKWKSNWRPKKHSIFYSKRTSVTSNTSPRINLPWETIRKYNWSKSHSATLLSNSLFACLFVLNSTLKVGLLQLGLAG